MSKHFQVSFITLKVWKEKGLNFNLQAQKSICDIEFAP